MPFTIYKSNDTSAPTISGTAGDLTTALDAILVNGYGSKSAAGWTIDKTATNKRAYKMAASGSLVQNIMRIRDNAGGTGGAKEAQIRGFATMSDIDTGTSPFPSTALSALTDNSWIIRKSVTADAATRPWIAFADGRQIMMWIQSGDTANYYHAFYFGDMADYVPASTNPTICCAKGFENNPAISTSALFPCGQTSLAAQAGYSLAMSHLGTGAGTGFTLVLFSANLIEQTTTAHSLTGLIAAPNPADGGLYLHPCFVVDITTGGNKTLRGELRKLYATLQPSSTFSDGDTVSGTGAYAGRTFQVVKLVGISTGYACLVETT